MRRRRHARERMHTEPTLSPCPSRSGPSSTLPAMLGSHPAALPLSADPPVAPLARLIPRKSAVPRTCPPLVPVRRSAVALGEAHPPPLQVSTTARPPDPTLWLGSPRRGHITPRPHHAEPTSRAAHIHAQLTSPPSSPSRCNRSRSAAPTRSSHHRRLAPTPARTNAGSHQRRLAPTPARIRPARTTPSSHERAARNAQLTSTRSSPSRCNRPRSAAPTRSSHQHAARINAGSHQRRLASRRSPPSRCNRSRSAAPTRSSHQHAACINAGSHQRQARIRPARTRPARIRPARITPRSHHAQLARPARNAQLTSTPSPPSRCHRSRPAASTPSSHQRPAHINAQLPVTLPLVAPRPLRPTVAHQRYRSPTRQPPRPPSLDASWPQRRPSTITVRTRAKLVNARHGHGSRLAALLAHASSTTDPLPWEFSRAGVARCTGVGVARRTRASR